MCCGGVEQVDIVSTKVLIQLHIFYHVSGFSDASGSVRHLDGLTDEGNLLVT